MDPDPGPGVPDRAPLPAPVHALAGPPAQVRMIYYSPPWRGECNDLHIRRHRVERITCFRGRRWKACFPARAFASSGPSSRKATACTGTTWPRSRGRGAPTARVAGRSRRRRTASPARARRSASPCGRIPADQPTVDCGALLHRVTDGCLDAETLWERLWKDMTACRADPAPRRGLALQLSIHHASSLCADRQGSKTTR